MFAAVCNKVWRLTEALAAMSTFVRFFASMNKHVLLHVWLLMKSLRTVFTREGSDVSMNQHVRGKSWRAFKMLSASLTFEYLYRRVGFLVLRKADVMTEGFATRYTSVRTASGVCTSYVYLQTMRCAKQFLTRVACKRLLAVGGPLTNCTLQISSFIKFCTFWIERDFPDIYGQLRSRKLPAIDTGKVQQFWIIVLCQETFSCY